MIRVRPVPLFLGLALTAAAASAAASSAAAQQAGSAPAVEPSAREAPTARVAVLDVAFYNAGANLVEASDHAKAELATDVLHRKLAELLPGQLADSAALAAAEQSGGIRASSGGQACNVVLRCAREAAQAVGARWVVMAKVSKTSNLIWLLSAQLVHVPSGTIILDDSTELKGDPEAMVKAGTRIFAERVARTVRNGGVANNFPNQP